MWQAAQSPARARYSPRSICCAVGAKGSSRARDLLLVAQLEHPHRRDQREGQQQRGHDDAHRQLHRGMLPQVIGSGPACADAGLESAGTGCDDSQVEIASISCVVSFPAMVAMQSGAAA